MAALCHKLWFPLSERSFVHAYGPFLSALSTPLCDCGLPPVMKQSRHLESAGCAYYYTCKLKRPLGLELVVEACNFFRWIDGHELFDPKIMLFPFE